MSNPKLRIHCIQHVDFEGIGYIKSWARINNHTLSYSLLYEKEKYPKQEDFDWLIIMGGPMNIYEESRYPWLVGEKLFIKKTIESNKTVLGFCLGSQLIADVLGAKVKRNRFTEIGWFTISLTEKNISHKLFKDVDLDQPVFHWHGDTFEIPDKSERIAYSNACDNQAFIYGDRVIGFQFHLEVTPESLLDMVNNGKNELIESEYIQTDSSILSKQGSIEYCNQTLTKILNRLATQSL